MRKTFGELNVGEVFTFNNRSYKKISERAAIDKKTYVVKLFENDIEVL